MITTSKGIRYAFLYDYILKARKRLLKSPKYLAVLLFLVTFAVGYINK